MALTITNITIGRWNGAGYTTLDQADDGTNADDDWNDIGAAITEDGPDTMAWGTVVLKGTNSLNSAQALARRYRVQFRTNFQPSFFYCFNRPFGTAETGEAAAAAWDDGTGYFPIAITSLGGGVYQVRMHMVGSRVRLSDRYQWTSGDASGANAGSEDNYFLNFGAEQISADAQWVTPVVTSALAPASSADADFGVNVLVSPAINSLKAVIASYPNIMGDGEGEHSAVDDNGDPIEGDDSGGPPQPCVGMCVYSDVQGWNFTMDSVQGTGGLMGVAVNGEPEFNVGTTLNMFIPYQLALWMGVPIHTVPAVVDVAYNEITGDAVNFVRVGAAPTITVGETTRAIVASDLSRTTDVFSAYRTSTTGGFMLNVDDPLALSIAVERAAERGPYGLRFFPMARAVTSTFLIGSTGSSPCFHGDTLVTMAFGGMRKKIKDVRVGDRVRVVGGGVREVHHVTCTRRRECVAFHRDALGPDQPSRPLLVTPNHLLRLHGRLRRADELERLCRPGTVHRTPPVTVYHVGLADWTFVETANVTAETLAWLPAHHRVRPARPAPAAAATPAGTPLPRACAV